MTERPPLFVHRRGNFLQPWAPVDEGTLAEYPTATRLRAVLTQPRNLGRLRLYFSLLDLVRHNMDNPPPRETLHDGIKLRLGLTTPVKFATGEIVDVPKSIAFDSMPEEEFAQFFEAFKLLIRASPAMERAAREMLGEPV